MSHNKQTARFDRFSERCPECGGGGTLTRYFGGGEFISEIDCDRCHGRGRIGNCRRCGGSGTVWEQGVRIECPDCRGAGALGDCRHCGGTGSTAAVGDADCPACDGRGFV